MTRPFLITTVLIGITVRAAEPTSKPTISGKLGTPIQLLNGKDLDGWYWVARPPKDGAVTQPAAKMQEVWSVRGGVLHDKGKPIGYLRTTKDAPANFVL